MKWWPAWCLLLACTLIDVTMCGSGMPPFHPPSGHSPPTGHPYNGSGITPDSNNAAAFVEMQGVWLGELHVIEKSVFGICLPQNQRKCAFSIMLSLSQIILTEQCDSNSAIVEATISSFENGTIKFFAQNASTMFCMTWEQNTVYSTARLVTLNPVLCPPQNKLVCTNDYNIAEITLECKVGCSYPEPPTKNSLTPKFIIAVVLGVLAGGIVFVVSGFLIFIKCKRRENPDYLKVVLPPLNGAPIALSEIGINGDEISLSSNDNSD